MCVVLSFHAENTRQAFHTCARMMARESASTAHQAMTASGRLGSGGSLATGKASASMAKFRASDRLEEDAQAMAERLIQLRLKMLEDKQRLEKELPAKFGGSRWRSAQENIGSVSRYAKDLGDRLVKPAKKKMSDKPPEAGSVAETKPTKKKKKKAKCDAAIGVPSLATVEKWTMQHVLAWLSSLGMDEFHSAFEFHQVTGAVLLAMEPDEFTQIGVSRLSARNTLWTELERVKDATKNALRRGSQEAGTIIDPKIRDVAPVPKVSSPGKGPNSGVHWSHVKPFRDPSTTCPQAELSVNLADGEFNEDASHASFMKALLDWRVGDDTIQDGDGHGGGNDDGMWFNPSVPSNNETDADSDEGGGGGGGALLDGDYDEAKEQEAFRRAVMAWRTTASPDTNKSDSRPSTAEVERIEQACATDQRKSCWQCYRVVRAEMLLRDGDTQRDFCGKSCQAAFKHEHVRLYAKQ